ncbi:MAG TPA: hypothetical protein VFD08_01290 [Clostridia bacterium]|nr:hypothetical protein [Clostridia bacterium]
MKYKVVYFTRTGNSRRVAKKISSRLSCEMIEIRDNKSWKGPIGYVRGGFYSFADRGVDISLSKKLGDYDELIVVSSLWAGKIAPTTRKFLKEVPDKKVHLLVTSMGTILKKRPAYKSVSDIVDKKENEDQVITSLLGSLL